MVKYLFKTSNAAVVPARRAETTLAPGSFAQWLHDSAEELADFIREQNLPYWAFYVANGLMLLVYVMQFVFTFVTHRALYEESVPGEEEHHKANLPRAIIMLIASTVAIAVISEIFVGTVEPMAESAGLHKTCVGIILVPIIGNAAEHSSAIIMAMKDKMNAAIEIALGSSLQIILFVVPVLTLLSLFFTPMSIVFTPFELVAVTGSVLIANRVASDGESNWLEGLQLVTVYIMIGAAFFFV
jgi:Ca2+:H+ antiporter